MKESKPLSTGIKVLMCDFCGTPVTSGVPFDTIVRAMLMCPECLERVPENLANKFLDSATWPGVHYKSEAVNEVKSR